MGKHVWRKDPHLPKPSVIASARFEMPGGQESGIFVASCLVTKCVSCAGACTVKSNLMTEHGMVQQVSLYNQYFL